MDIPDPEPGLVICYSYLWNYEHVRGQEEGTKNRPCAIVSAVDKSYGQVHVTVSPVTHALPRDQSTAIEIPLKTKERLGLDGERSWIVCSEANRFVWPGADLRAVSYKEQDRCVYGVLPPKFFTAVKRKISFFARGRQLQVIKRTD